MVRTGYDVLGNLSPLPHRHLIYQLFAANLLILGVVLQSLAQAAWAVIYISLSFCDAEQRNCPRTIYEVHAVEKRRTVDELSHSVDFRWRNVGS